MKKVISFIDSSQRDIIGLAKSLIRIPTVNPPGINYEKIVHILESKLKKIGLKTRVIETPKKLVKNFSKNGSPRLNLIADWDTGSKKTLHINGHYDVVPVGKGFKDPFNPYIKGGKLYGRGAEDMKGTIAAQIFAIEAVKKSGIIPNFNVQLSFTPDEETGGESGFGYLVKKGLIKADFAIGEGHRDEFVSIGNKGFIWANVTIYGKSTHGSTPYKGINAFEKLLNVAGKFNDLRIKTEKRKTKFYLKDPRDRFATMTLGGILKGPEKTNIVPEKIVFSIDRRILPEENFNMVKRELEGALALAKKIDKSLRAEIEITSSGDALSIDPKSPICRAMAKSIKKVLKKDAKFAITPVTTDMRFLIEKGVPAVGYSASGGGSWHSDDEFVYVKSVVDTAKVYAITIANI